MHAPETHAFLAGLHPMGRMGEIRDIVEAVLYLESASFVTGETLHVDGGAQRRTLVTPMRKQPCRCDHPDHGRGDCPRQKAVRIKGRPTWRWKAPAKPPALTFAVIEEEVEPRSGALSKKRRKNTGF